MNTEALRRQLEDDGIEHLWIIYHDYGGRPQAKAVPKARFASAIERGIVFARANLDFNFEDHQAATGAFMADSGDFLAVPDPASYAPVPYHKATARMHAFMRQNDGSAWDGCPRTRLQQIVESYAAKGLSLRVSFEPEFMLFERDEDGQYQPADWDGMFTLTGLDRHYELWQRVSESLQQMGIQVAQLGKEYGPGQYEATTDHDTPIRAVDNYLTFKEVVRALAREAGFIATFMPKPFADLPGNGLHIHLSIWDKDGEHDLSIGETEDEPLSKLGKHFVGGLLAHAPALLGAGSPIVNSYKRLLPGSWSPAHVCWGVGNRAALVRVPAMGRRRHLEFRSGDNAANPYIFLTSLLAAGLDGVENEIEPPMPVNEDVGHLSDAEAQARHLAYLPRTLKEALDALAADAVVTEALGPVVAPEYLKVKRSELAAYDVHVHPWERNLYLEVI